MADEPVAEPTGPIVELVGVSKQYSATGNQVRALDNVSFTIKRRGIVVVLGPSGAGKTTLLNLIAGLEKPSKGTVMVLGNELSASDENSLASFRCANIGFIFQSYNLVSTLTAGENVEVMMELAGWQDYERNEKLTQELVGAVGLSERLNHLPSQLSGGEQQRIAIARALANDPPLILADEPTGNLDSTTGLGIVQLLMDLKEKKGKTVLIATHDDRIVEKADLIYRLEKGVLSKA